MKQLVLASVLLFTNSAFSSVYCWVNNEKGEHFELELNKSVATGEPYGTVRLGKEGSRDYIVLIKDGFEKLIFFKKYLSISEDRFGKKDGNLVCQ